MRNRITRTFFVFSCFALAGAGLSCSSSSLSDTIDMDKLKDVSRQGQLWVYDAENEIVVALDKLDDAKDDLLDIQRKKDQAEKRLEQIEKRRNRIAVETMETWIRYLERMEEWNESRIKANRIGVLVALATVELAKAQVIQREDLPGGKDFSLSTFQDQYNRLKKEFEKERKIVNAKRKTARNLENKWWTLRRRFIAQTGNHDIGLWTD